MSALEHPDAGIGLYVLGLDDPQERDQWREHLGACASCRLEWQRLRELPPLLARAEELQPPPRDLEDRLLARVVGVRRHGHHR